jgi:hypothetical protein
MEDDTRQPSGDGSVIDMDELDLGIWRQHDRQAVQDRGAVMAGHASCIGMECHPKSAEVVLASRFPPFTR